MNYSTDIDYHKKCLRESLDETLERAEKMKRAVESIQVEKSIERPAANIARCEYCDGEKQVLNEVFFGFQVVCLKCGARGPISDDPHEAIDRYRVGK